MAHGPRPWLDSAPFEKITTKVYGTCRRRFTRGYLDFTRLLQMHEARAFFVTRAKSNMNARLVYSAKVDRSSGIICDQAIVLNGHYVAQDYPEQLRRIGNKDSENHKIWSYRPTTRPCRP